MSEITYNKNIEPNIKAIIESQLNNWTWLIPAWCKRLQINLVDGGDFSADIETSYEYRYATLRIDMSWFNIEDSHKTLDLVHELCHNFYNPMYWFARDNFDILLGDDSERKHRDSVRDTLRRFNEIGTQDLAYALINKFKDTKKFTAN